MQLYRVTTESSAKCINAMDALDRLNSSVPPVILDVRDENEFRRAHIDGALWVPADDLTCVIDDLPRNLEYVTVCRSGARSGVAAWQMRAAGFSVVNLCGGLLAWQRAGYEVVCDN